MSIITVKTIYNRRKINFELNPSATATIELYVYQKKPRIRKYISTGIVVPPHLWNADNGNVSTKHTQAPHLNKIIRDAIQSIEDYAYSLRASSKEMTEQMLIDHINGKKNRNDSFLDFFSTEIDPALKRGTRKEHKYTYNILKEFKKDILFSEINYTLIQEFERFMRFTLNLKPNTIYKHHQHVNRFLKLATLKDLFLDKNNPYRNFKVRKEPSNRINLTFEELERIEKIEVTEGFPELQYVKDLFLFSCYTGLRFSDITTLEKSHIKDNPKGIAIVKKMEKVPKPVTLPLALLFEGKPLIIINKYLQSNSQVIFPHISNQHANRQLKIIATLAKISMRLTFHIARHTFGSMLADLTQNPYLIMDLMGHADVKTSMIYIHRSQERINRQLEVVNWNPK